MVYQSKITYDCKSYFENLTVELYKNFKKVLEVKNIKVFYVRRELEKK